MEHRTQKRRSGRLRWWHHAVIVGVLGVGALYLVGHLYRGMLLYYAGPGDPMWLDDIIAWWQIVFGTLLGIGVGVWLPSSLRPSPVQKERASRDRTIPDTIARVGESA
jgi:hypothetical protein